LLPNTQNAKFDHSLRAETLVREVDLLWWALEPQGIEVRSVVEDIKVLSSF